MAPHDTNTKKEARRHAAPLIGMAAALVVALLAALWFFGNDDAVSETEAVLPEDPATTAVD